MSQARNDREQLLAEAFVGLADTLVDEYDVIDVLDRLVGYSVTLLAADAAGIMLVDRVDGCGSWRPPARSPTGPSSCRSRPTRVPASSASEPAGP